MVEKIKMIQFKEENTQLAILKMLLFFTAV